MYLSPEDTSSQALQEAYDKATEVAWVQSDVVRENFLQGRKAEPEVGKVYMFGKTTPARFSNTFAQYTGEGWKLVYVHGWHYSNSPYFKHLIFDDCKSTTKSRDSCSALIDFIAKNAEYIKFALQDDGTMDYDAFEAWSRLRQALVERNRSCRKQMFQDLPPCVLLSKPTDGDDDCYYVKGHFIIKGSDDNFCAYNEANPNLLVDHQTEDKSYDSARALYERSMGKLIGHTD